MRGFRPNQEPYGSRGLEGLRAMIPKIEAMGFKQAQPADPAWFQDQQREQEQRKQEALAAGQAADSAAQAGAYAPGVTQRSPGASELYMQDRANEMKDQWGQGKYAQAAGTAARTAAQGLGMYALEAADKLATPVIDAARGFGSGLIGSDTNTTKPATQPAPPAAAPSLADQPNPTDQRLAAGTQRSPLNGPVSPPSSPSQPAVASGREVVPGVFNHGRGQYSDDPTGMNMPKGFTGQPSAANNAILERMSDQSKAESMARLGFGPQAQYAAEVQRAKNINADEAARNNSVGARMQRLADPFTAEGRAMRNLQMNIDSSLDRKGRPTADTAALVAQSKAMSDGYLAEPNQQRTIAGQLQREGMQQAGENQRAGIRAGLEQQRINQSGAELGLRTEAAGFQTRAAKRRESVYDNYSKAKTDEDRQAIAKQFPDLFGQAKDAAHRMEVVRGKTDPMTGQSSGDYVVVQDPKTGEVRQIQMGAASAAPTQALPKAGEVRNGYRFKGGNPNDQANWQKV